MKQSTSLRSGEALRQEVARCAIMPFIGIHDVFSAAIAARHYDALFVSGFGFAASQYGLPDVGFIAWPDIVAFVQRVRAVVPEHHVLVDIDDGYGDADIASYVAAQLEAVGASGVVLEDQQRPRRCGHLDGKRLLDLDDYLKKLERILEVRRDLFVIARTDASDPKEIARRVNAFANAGADAVLVDGMSDLDMLATLTRSITPPLAFNQIAGGKSAPYSLDRLAQAGVALAIYSTPCLFAAQGAMESAMKQLRQNSGRLSVAPGQVLLKDCNEVLNENLGRKVQRRTAIDAEPSPVVVTRTLHAIKR